MLASRFITMKCFSCIVSCVWLTAFHGLVVGSLEGRAAANVGHVAVNYIGSEGWSVPVTIGNQNFSLALDTTSGYT